MKPFPGFDRLYELVDPLANRPFRGRFMHAGTGIELSRAEESSEQPISVYWGMGSAIPSEVIWTTSAYPLIISVNIVEFLTKSGLSGWKTYPVRVFNKHMDECPGFVGLAVSGRCGRIDLSKSVIALREFPGGFFPEFQGHYFDPASWDGSDFYMEAPDKKWRFSMDRLVTQEVVDLFRRHSIGNIRFVKLTDAYCSTNVFEIGLKYLLPRDFRARVSDVYCKANLIPPDRYR